MISWFEKHNKLSWMITILIAITIFYISTLTFEGQVIRGGIGFKSIIYHFSAFFFLASFFLISLTKGKNKKLIPIAIIIAIIYGITDEIHQFFVPNRDCSLFDVLTNSIGIIFAGVLYSIRLRIKKV